MYTNACMHTHTHTHTYTHTRIYTHTHAFTHTHTHTHAHMHAHTHTHTHTSHTHTHTHTHTHAHTHTHTHTLVHTSSLGSAIVVETPQNIPSVYSSLVYNPLCTLLFNDSTLSPLLWHDANVGGKLWPVNAIVFLPQSIYTTVYHQTVIVRQFPFENSTTFSPIGLQPLCYSHKCCPAGDYIIEYQRIAYNIRGGCITKVHYVILRWDPIRWPL